MSPLLANLCQSNFVFLLSAKNLFVSEEQQTFSTGSELAQWRAEATIRTFIIISFHPFPALSIVCHKWEVSDVQTAFLIFFSINLQTRSCSLCAEEEKQWKGKRHTCVTKCIHSVFRSPCPVWNPWKKGWSPGPWSWDMKPCLSVIVTKESSHISQRNYPPLYIPSLFSPPPPSTFLHCSPGSRSQRSEQKEGNGTLVPASQGRSNCLSPASCPHTGSLNSSPIPLFPTSLLSYFFQPAHPPEGPYPYFRVFRFHVNL